MGRGEVSARLGPERHARAAQEAARRGVSVNQFICEAIDAALEGGGMPRSAAISAALAELSAVAGQLRSGFVLVPSSEAGGSSWDGLLDQEKK